MESFLQQVLNGMTLGGIYGLVALGLTLVYGVLSVPNFAHGTFYMVGAYATLQLMASSGLGYWTAMVGAAGCVAALAALCERLVYRPLRDASGLQGMVASIGLLLFLQAAAQIVWGADFRRIASPYGGVIEIGGVAAPVQRLLIVAAVVTLMTGVHLFLRCTVTGATIVAVSQNREGAALMGIDSRRVARITFALSGALAAVAAALYAPIHLVYPAMGNLVVTKAFVIIILGGMGSVYGAMAGGMILGLAESLGAFYVSPDHKDLVAFVLLVAVLALRPHGLFGRAVH